MPFWEQCRCCRNCRFWRQRDPSDEMGHCQWVLVARPFWMDEMSEITKHDDGTTCRAYRHEAHKLHELDASRSYLAKAQVGDQITMRTYDIGAISRTEAEVVKHTPRFVIVRMFNDYRRVRLEATAARHRAGSVVGMEDWGVDLQAPIMRGTVELQRPERAEGMLAGVKRGDRVPVMGLPPFDGQRKQLYVTSTSKNLLFLAFGRRKLRMHRAGPLAGIIEGEVWTLDTTGD